MSISQLATTRLQISLQSIQSDSTLNDNLKLMFKNIYECIVENFFNIQLMESQLSSKSNSVELNYGLSQKLSVGEFLQYFEKLQNIIRILQANQQKQQEKIGCNFDENMWKMNKLEERLNMMEKQLERKKKIAELEGESVRNSIKQVIKKQEKVKNTLQTFQIQIQDILNKRNTNGGQKTISITKQIQMQKSINNIMEQIKHVQVFTQQMKCSLEYLINKSNIFEQKLQQLIQVINPIHDTNPNTNTINNNRDKQQQPSIITTTTIKSIHNKASINKYKYVTFTELRQVLSNLQQNLTISLNKYIVHLLPTVNYEKFSKKQHKSIKQSGVKFLSELQESISAQNNNQPNPNQISQNKPYITNSHLNFHLNNQDKSNAVNELTPNFNYRHFHSLERSSRKQNISQAQQMDPRQSIKLSWIYNSESSSDISIVKFVNYTKAFCNTNHHLSSSFLKNSTNLQTKNQPKSPFPINSQQLHSNYSTLFYNINDNSVIINQRGFYQIRCGLLPLYALQVKIFCSGTVIASHSFHEIPKNKVCRAIMIYIRNHDGPSEITIFCKPISNQNENEKDNGRGSNKKKHRNDGINQRKKSPTIQGFICLQKLC